MMELEILLTTVSLIHSTLRLTSTRTVRSAITLIRQTWRTVGLETLQFLFQISTRPLLLFRRSGITGSLNWCPTTPVRVLTVISTDFGNPLTPLDTVDGLRIDTVKHVQKSFWPGYNSAAGVYCVGEVFDGDPAYTCPYQSYLDGVLNYPMYVSRYVERIPADQYQLLPTAVRIRVDKWQYQRSI